MLDIINTTQTKHPSSIPYTKMTERVLGKKYELSVVFCGEHLMRRINRESRGKDYATNVLSFPLSDSSGEMFLCLPVCRRQHKDFDRSFSNFIGFLFVHGLVHLKGHDHGATMSKLEARYCKEFGL